MAQQDIPVGSSPNDGTGIKWREAWIRAQSNFDELYGFHTSVNNIVIVEESDFPQQDATTISLTGTNNYIISAVLTTAKRFIISGAPSITANNFGGPLLTYSGSGSMFTGTDASFTLKSLQISCPLAKVFDFKDNVGGLQFLNVNEMICLACSQVGTLDNIGSFLISVSQAAATNQGINLIGANWNIFSVEKFNPTSASATFIGVDFGTAVINTIEINQFRCTAPVGAIGLKGATGNANVPADMIATVRDSSFVGGMTDISGLTTDDFRWVYSGNTPTKDTIADLLLSFNGNTTETVISVVDTPVIVNAIWSVIRSSLWTGTTGGRGTYNGERDLITPIDVSIGLISASGGAIDVSVYVARDGSVDADSVATVEVSGTKPRTLSIPWQDLFGEAGFVEVFVENNTNTTNIIVENCKLRGR